MKFLSKVFAALVILFFFSYLACTMYFFDSLTGRQFYLVMLISGFMVQIFGTKVAAIITIVLGLFAAYFAFRVEGEEDDDDNIILPRKL